MEDRKNGTSCRGLALSNQFAHGKDPQRVGLGHRFQPGLVVRWTVSLHLVRIHGRIFTTAPPGGTALTLRTPLLETTPVPSHLLSEWRNVSLNDFRFAVFLDYLRRQPRKERPEYITMSDLFDSVFQHNPFAILCASPHVDLWVTATYRLRIKDSPFNLLQYTTCSSHWNISAAENKSVMESACVCPNIWGGKTIAVMRLMQCMVDLFLIPANDLAHNCNCPAFAVCLSRARVSGARILGADLGRLEPFSNAMWDRKRSLSHRWPIVHRHGKEVSQTPNSAKVIMARLEHRTQSGALPSSFAELAQWLQAKYPTSIVTPGRGNRSSSQPDLPGGGKERGALSESESVASGSASLSGVWVLPSRASKHATAFPAQVQAAVAAALTK